MSTESTSSDEPAEISGADAQSQPSDQRIPGTPRLAFQDRSRPTAGDSRFLVISGGIFFVIMLVQYAWIIFDKPQPIVWELRPTSTVRSLDINTATVAQWAAMQSVGSDLAAQIVADRDKNGPFRNIDDVGRVSGIDTSTLDRIRPLLTMESTTAQTSERHGQSIEPAENQ